MTSPAPVLQCCEGVYSKGILPLDSAASGSGVFSSLFVPFPFFFFWFVCLHHFSVLLAKKKDYVQEK